MQNYNYMLGKAGEDKAKAFLLAKGYEFLDANWRFEKLELDLVFRQNDEIVFVEVKTRSSANYGGAVNAVSSAKKRNLVQAAQAWLLEHNLWDKSSRFDVICITKKGNHGEVEHYVNAIDARQIMDCGHTHRQLW